jgi:hypothetical protein
MTFSEREESEIKVLTTPTSDTAAIVRLRRDTTRKCWAKKSHGRPSE